MRAANLVVGFSIVWFGALPAEEAKPETKPAVYAVEGGKLATIVVHSTTDLEDIVTTTNAVAGVITCDRAKGTGSVSLTVQAGRLDTGIPMRNEHLQGEKWLDTARFPEITFRSTAVKHLQGDEYEITGDFAMHGVTRSVIAKAVVQFRDDEKSAKVLGGPAVKVAATFSIKLSDFGIPPAALGLKVSDRLDISLSVFGVDKSAAKEEPKK